MASDEEIIDEDEYEESEATMLFAEEVKKQFKKEFPLKAETEKKLKQATFRRHAPVEARRLNFDLTISPVAPVELASAKKDKESAQRQLESLRQEHERLKQTMRTKEEKLAEKSIDLEMNREKMLELQTQVAELQRDRDENLVNYNQSIETWKSFGRKYYTWFTMASSQLDTIQVYVNTDGKFDNEEDISKINGEPREVLRSFENFDLDEETAQDLAAGSIQEYEGAQFSVREKAPDPILEAQREMVRADVSAANFTLPQSNQTVLDETNATMMPEDQTMMTDGCFANRSLIDYEKDEKIQRLLLENSVLKDRLNLSIGRAEKSMVLEEQNRNLEFEKNTLQKQLDNTFSEMEAIRIGQARNIFKIDENISTPSDNSSKQLQLIDRITELITKNNQLEKDFEAATSRMTKIMRESSDCERRNERLEDAFSNEKVKSQQLESERDELMENLEVKAEEIQELKKKLDEMQTQLEDALNNTVTASEAAPTSSEVPPQPTDAGNNTQIFHMGSNPLADAHAEFHANESRKRKLTDAPDGDQYRAEQFAELEERLNSCEREKKVLEDSYNLHKELASKFRQICVALTGLQIKLKDADEGLCTVQSEYEDGSTMQQFVFKYYYGTPQLDLLDVNSEMLRKWEPLMRKYIGERNSIPAFLSAMTLQLEQERDFDETMHERTHTFSVLHED